MRWKPGLAVVAGALLGLLPLEGQAVGVDAVRVGPVLIHDHFRYDLHIRIKNDPYPHEVREEYAFDGGDLGLGLQWHWGGARLETDFQITPKARSHYAFDQDTDFRPGTDFTHGDAGAARSRSVSVRQQLPVHDFGSAGRLQYQVGLERQWSGYGRVTTYDWNSNPALPSSSYQRQLNERAILYELNNGMTWSLPRTWGAWTTSLEATADPLAAVFLRNYIPQLVATSALGYGGSLGLGVEHGLGSWRLAVAGAAGEERGYRWVEGFQRQRFSLRLTLQPPGWF